MIKYTEDQIDFLIENNYGKTSIELAEMFNETFGTHITRKNIKTFRGNRHLDCGLTGRFEKGQKSWNKGKHWDDFISKEGQENSKKTCFKKGNKSWNCDSIGTEKWKSDHKNKGDEGFLYVKVQDGTKQNNWKQKHRLIWEQEYGPIPRGHKVIFKDGNRHNIKLDNLALVSNSQMLILNRHNLIFNECELTETGINIAKVIDKVNKKSREDSKRKEELC